MSGYVVSGVVFALLTAITVLLLTGRGANLIAGFNTLSKEEKAGYDKKTLCRFVGKILIPFDVLLIVGAICIMFKVPWGNLLIIIFGVACIPYIIFIAVYANTANRFKLKK